jgi:predicted lipoprotein
MAVFIVIAINIYSCNQVNDDSPESLNGDGVMLPDGTVFTRASLLEDLGACIIGEVENFEEQSLAFSTAVTAAASDPDQRDAAREAWRNAIDAWQQLEVMKVGPAGRKTQPGGLGLGDSIYAWPLNNPCAVDTYLASELYATDTDEVRFSANGLSAAEYLLFYNGDENACDVDEELNADGSWDALDESTLTSRRAAYAALTANTVTETATALREAWSPNGDNFLAELTQAGDGSRTYGKKRVAINALSDALFYVEWATKDNKLARPLGITACDEEICTDLLESQYGRRSKEHLRNNILGFRKLFTGCGADNKGLGFDDFLYAMGQPELAEDIDQAAQATIDAIDAIDEADLVTALEEDRQSVLAVHSALNRLTDLLRSDFLLVLSLELPQMVQGDND